MTIPTLYLKQFTKIYNQRSDRKSDQMKNYEAQQIWEVELNDELRLSLQKCWNTLAFLPPKKQTINLTPVAIWQHKKLQLTRTGDIMSNPNNLFVILTEHPDFAGRLGYNELTRTYSYNGADITDLDYSRLRLDLSSKLQLVFSRNDVIETAELVADGNKYHPIRDYLTSLSWDHKSRTEELLSLLQLEKTEINLAAVRKWMIAAVARIMKPGCKVDSIPVFAGLTGIGKSTAIRSLMHNEEWFSDEHIDFGSKDSKQIVQGKWIIELAELSAFSSKKDINLIKSDITHMVDEFRSPYDRKPKKYPRQFVYIGTTNETEFLTDPTSNRRFWILPNTGLIDTNQVAAIRDQLWAEAYSLFVSGEKWWMNKEQEKEMADISSTFEQKDAWYDEVAKYLLGKNFCTTSAVLDHINPGIKNNYDKARIVKILQFQKWQTKTQKVNGVCMSGWVPPIAKEGKPQAAGKQLPQTITMEMN